MKIYIPWHTIFLLVLLALSVQGCLGSGNNNTATNQNFQNVKTNTGQNLQVNASDSALFSGKIYFTQGRNLLVIDGSRNVHQLTHGYDVRDPAVSPDGRYVAFVVRYKYSALLVYMPINNTSPHWTVLRDGSGKYIPNPPYPAPISTHNWYAQPAWATDNTHLLFLSDLEKLTVNPGVDSQLLDMQVFSLSIHSPNTTQEVAYATFGDGGDRDPTYRPGHNQVVYTHYMYDSSQTQQVIQLYLIDANAIVNNPGKYHPGVGEDSPAVALTPASTSVANLMPAFSPDGNSLAYVRRIDVSTMGLYVMSVPPNIITDSNSPGFQKSALQPYQHSSLLIKGTYVSQPIWSPDGKQIAYLYYQNNEFDIWIANVTTDPKTGAYTIKGDPVPLTNGGIDADSRPFWTK
jgi:dipeptidyl aminopeptidase/acylaminoacyl peptidase